MNYGEALSLIHNALQKVSQIQRLVACHLKSDEDELHQFNGSAKAIQRRQAFATTIQDESIQVNH